jgi:hypothetical protein
MQKEVGQLINKTWAPVPPEGRERLSRRRSGSQTASPTSKGRSTSHDSSTPRKGFPKKSLRTWFWVLALLVFALVGLALWPVRILYLTLRENSDERWKRTVL